MSEETVNHYGALSIQKEGDWLVGRYYYDVHDQSHSHVLFKVAPGCLNEETLEMLTEFAKEAVKHLMRELGGHEVTSMDEFRGRDVDLETLAAFVDGVKYPHGKG